MRISPKLLLLVLFAALFVFTCANAAVSSDEIQQYPTDVLSTAIKSENHLNLSKEEKVQTASSSLPVSLRMIDDSAFEGTALISVAIPDSVTHIGNRAFANIPTLLGILIPDNTRFIGKDAFAGTGQVTITGIPGSYARTWARDNGIPFAPVAVFNASGGSVQIPGLYTGRTTQDCPAGNETIEIPKYSESNGRTNGEITAAKHEECFAFSLQGRSPPMAG